MVERSAVNRLVVGSNPTWGVSKNIYSELYLAEGHCDDPPCPLEKGGQIADQGLNPWPVSGSATRPRATGAPLANRRLHQGMGNTKTDHGDDWGGPAKIQSWRA